MKGGTPPLVLTRTGLPTSQPRQRTDKGGNFAGRSCPLAGRTFPPVRPGPSSDSKRNWPTTYFFKATLDTTWARYPDNRGYTRTEDHAPILAVEPCSVRRSTRELRRDRRANTAQTPNRAPREVSFPRFRGEIHRAAARYLFRHVGRAQAFVHFRPSGEILTK